MEVFVECLVKKRPTAKTNLAKAGIAVAGSVLSLVALIICLGISFISFLGLLIAAGVIYGAWLLIKTFDVEYEYILTNESLDIDKIVARSRRKRLTTVNMKNIEVLAPASDSYRAEFESAGVKTKIDASTGDPETTYFIRFAGNETGTTVVFFNPDQRILDGARQFSPRKVFQK